MKKLSRLCLCLAAIFSACKKNDSSTIAKPVLDVATIQADLQGTWYFNSYSASFYVNGVQDVHDDIATPAQLGMFDYLQFSSGGSALELVPFSQQSTPFSYSVTLTQGADSLIFSGAYHDRMKILSCSNTGLSLTETTSGGGVLTDRLGNSIQADKVVVNMFLSHSRE